MATSEVRYTGGLHTEATHLASGATIATDAPKDNQGKGEAFSPTDLLATSLASCMMTIIGIRAQEQSWPLGEMKARVTKTMRANPRRIGKIRIELDIADQGLGKEQRVALENAARTCPVALSLSPEVALALSIRYQSV